jgi:tripartite-type tricarboxylate transporter receptor subunit TctC
VAETVSGFSFVPWCALLVPAHTPPEIVARLNTAAVTALKDPAVRARLAELGFEVVGGTPGQLAAVMRAEFARMGELIRAANIRE